MLHTAVFGFRAYNPVLHRGRKRRRRLGEKRASGIKERSEEGLEEQSR